MANNWVAISGASSGIGKETSIYFSNKGFNILLIGRNIDRLNQLKKDLNTNSEIIVSDFLDLASVSKCAEKLKSFSLKGLVNNAGFIDRKPFLETSTKDWQDSFQVHVIAPVILTQSFIENFREDTGGFVTNVGSTLGVRPIPNTLPYSASKSALENWTRGLALEVASKKIRVNSVLPGIVDTPIHLFHSKKDQDSIEQIEFAKKLHPLGRLGKPEEVAEAIYYMSTAKWMTGSSLIIDGGVNL